MKEQLVSLFEYGDWVNQRLLDTAEVLTTEQFTQKVLPSFGSVHLTLAHMLGAEVIWFERLRGTSPKAMLPPDELATVAALRERWTTLAEDRHAYFAAADEAELAATMHWTNMRGQPYELPRWQVMLHVLNHATHHRSEVAAILTELGHEPDSTDLLEYYLMGAGQPWKPSPTPPEQTFTPGLPAKKE